MSGRETWSMVVAFEEAWQADGFQRAVERKVEPEGCERMAGATVVVRLGDRPDLLEEVAKVARLEHGAMTWSVVGRRTGGAG